MLNIHHAELSARFKFPALATNNMKLEGPSVCPNLAFPMTVSLPSLMYPGGPIIPSSMDEWDGGPLSFPQAWLPFPTSSNCQASHKSLLERQQSSLMTPTAAAPF